MDTFNLMNTLWPPSTNPANGNQNLHNLTFHPDPTNQMPPPHHFFLPHHKFMDSGLDPSTAASFMNATCDLHDLLNRLNANTSASDLATQTRMFEAKHSTDLMGEQTTLPTCSNTNLFQTSALSTSTSSLLSENVHEEKSLPQSSGFPTMAACVDEQGLSSHSSPSSSISTATFPIMSSADSFLLAALNTLVSAQTSELDNANGDNPVCSGDLKNVLLCQVCNDRASGLHYGVQSCEGCKGFFRRSIQQSISYRPCSKQQQCSIVRNNRNRCQACRLKKCLSVGMSRDAVRFGRVPKREKAKMAEEMQRASIRSQIDSMSVELEDDHLLATSIHSAYVELANAIQRDIINVPSRNFFIGDGNESLLNSSFYLPAIIAIVNFAKSVKGFQLLYQNDRIQLLKSSFFQILLLRLSTLKVNNRTELLDPNSIPQLLFLNSSMENSDSLNLLRNSIVEFVQRFRLLGLDEQQQSLVTALILCQSESTATQFQEASLTKMLQEKLWWLLQNSIFPNQQVIHSITGPVLIQSLFATFSELKTLNSVYQKQMQNLRCYTISTPTTMETPFETKFLESKQPIRPIAKKPKINKPNDKLREKNRVLAELLEKPSQVAQFQKMSKSIEELEEDQPLNLCVRDAQRANN